MTTGTPSVDNFYQEMLKISKNRLEENKELKKELYVKLKKANRKEREFIIFKLFFNELTNYEKKVLTDLMESNPFFFDRLWKIIDTANSAMLYSKSAIYNRDERCIEIINIYKSLLDKMSKLAKELNISNSLELSILFSYLLWNGYLSKTKKHIFNPNNRDEILGLLFIEITNGKGVCRNYSEMLKDFLEYSGYRSVILENNLNNINIDYTMDIKKRKNKHESIPEKTSIFNRKPNHVFNLIEDQGFYIYDSTNLLLYQLKNRNTAVLINGRGKNIVYPYDSYDFCYSKEDEKILDSLFTTDTFPSPYKKNDFISTCEVNLELIKDSTSLVEDFYKEAKRDLLKISDKSKKVLSKKRK